MSKKRILIYNWDHIDGKQGGGVVVYIRNLLKALTDKYDLELFYLNSGLTYTKDGKIRIADIDNTINKQIKTFEVLNSPVLAPVMESSVNIKNYLNDKSLYPVVKAFIEKYKFDVIHFNNIEGLSLQTINLKKDFPHIKIIYSAHNYSTICTRTNLWKDEHTNGHNCDKQSFKECIDCYSKTINSLELFRRKHPKFQESKVIYKFYRITSALRIECGTADLYQNYEKSTVQSLNNNFDYILAVSKRVKDILIAHGLSSKKVYLSYIGTEVANHPKMECAVDPYADPFTVLYMGYMNKEKGFDFFIKSMIRLCSEDDAYRKMHIRIVARMQEKYEDDIQNLKKINHHVEVINGYTKDNQADLLKDVNLGIVPVAWEDNLPQVAIEQVAYGVPILVSDRGGAQEICNNSTFVFKAEVYKDFKSKFTYIYTHRDELSSFFDHTMQLVTMDEHIRDIAQYYNLK